MQLLALLGRAAPRRCASLSAAAQPQARRRGGAARPRRAGASRARSALTTRRSCSAASRSTARSARTATAMKHAAFPQPRRAGRPGIHRRPGQGARGRPIKVTDGPERQRRDVQAPRPPGRSVSRSPSRTSSGARVANGGGVPPDMSVLAKARSYERGFPAGSYGSGHRHAISGAGPDYIQRSCRATRSRRRASRSRRGTNYNEYFPGHDIAMPPPLSDGASSIRRIPTAAAGRDGGPIRARTSRPS